MPSVLQNHLLSISQRKERVRFLMRNSPKFVKKVFDMTPRGIIDRLKLRRPIYKITARHGHFGSEDSFTWEKTDMVDALRNAAGVVDDSSPRCRETRVEELGWEVKVLIPMLWFYCQTFPANQHSLR